ncbi:AbrB family transcriptional regulator [Pseudaminobacter arsenicus]|uniref:AbrB family transcriptional regulator n=1 Tax=Borborobacter arsenicus TaxID=1851146 RepID=A0A432V052_9HYPH|nr:AbrB family transcriptional regulator [Pseudaminobacter arsenicus]RUM95566.1 AbrB family transcriptional regulator [Pseudaminobacter arsenicus]
MQWALILLVSLVLTGLLELADLPAALLIGPMLAGIIAGTNGATVRLPRPVFFAAQAIIGCLIAASIELEILVLFVHEWPLFLGAVLATVAASSFLGWLISRWKILPGTTAVWGSAPGASTAMVLMAETFGADARLVAFMQYLRVIFVSVTAALVARLWVDTSSVAIPEKIWFPAIDWLPFGSTLAVAAIGGIGGRLLRLPSPWFLGSLILGVTLHLAGLVDFQLPEWLLAMSYALIGWAIGLNFSRPILRHAARALPQIALSILVLMSFCGGLAWLLSRYLGIDPLTAYLATSPGGMDSVAIIAAAADNVNISFVMAMQTARFLFVLMLGPWLARLVARLVKE